MPKYGGMIFSISARFCMEYWRALIVAFTRAENLSGVGFYLFVGNADATVRISGHVIAGISNAVEAVALKHKVSRRRQKGRSDSSRSKGDNGFFLGSDDERRDILVWNETVFLQDHLHH